MQKLLFIFIIFLSSCLFAQTTLTPSEEQKFTRVTSYDELSVFITRLNEAGNLLNTESLPNFTLPGDISSSKRYYKEDIVEPEFVVNPDETMDVPAKPGIGVKVNSFQINRN